MLFGTMQSNSPTAFVKSLLCQAQWVKAGQQEDHNCKRCIPAALSDTACATDTSQNLELSRPCLRMYWPALAEAAHTSDLPGESHPSSLPHLTKACWALVSSNQRPLVEAGRLTGPCQASVGRDLCRPRSCGACSSRIRLHMQTTL